MELRDYLRMLRRGWPTILLVMALGLGSAVLYLAITPKQYVASAVLFISPKNPHSVTDLQLGSQYAVDTAPSCADIINSATVLDRVTDVLPSSYSVSQLRGMVAATARPTTALIDVTVKAGSAVQAANVANATATTAAQVIPGIAEGDRVHATLITLQVTRRASVPTTPVSPNASHILALGFIVGLALGLGLTISRQTLDTRLRRPEDIDRLSHLPVLTVVPKLNRHERAGIVVRDDPTSVLVESFRSLRTNLTYLQPQARRSLLFTGVSVARDDAQVPINLAWSIAQTGRRVLLLDLDLRQSIVGNTLQLPGLSGMTDVLAGNAELADVSQETTQPNLHVVVTGAGATHPSDLLSGTNMEEVLRLAEQHYDYVILHAPPLLRYTDAAVLSMIASHTLVTVSAGHTRAVDLSSALGVLRNVHIEPMGIVLAGARGFGGQFRSFRGIRGIRGRASTDFPRRRNNDVSAELAPAAVGRSASSEVVPRARVRPHGLTTATEAAEQRRRANNVMSPSSDPRGSTSARQFRGTRARTPAGSPRRRSSQGTSGSTSTAVARPPSESVERGNGQAQARLDMTE